MMNLIQMEKNGSLNYDDVWPLALWNNTTIYEVSSLNEQKYSVQESGQVSCVCFHSLFPSVMFVEMFVYSIYVIDNGSRSLTLSLLRKYHEIDSNFPVPSLMKI